MIVSIQPTINQIIDAHGQRFTDRRCDCCKKFLLMKVVYTDGRDGFYLVCDHCDTTVEE